MDPRWAVLCMLAVTWGIMTHGMNISSVVGDPRREPAYLDWEIGIMLTTPYDYMGTGDFGATAANSWQHFYKQKATYQAYKLSGRNNTRLNNATLAIQVNGKIGKWGYESTTSCATMMTMPCNSYSKAHLSGTGLVPITCGLQNPALPAALGNVLCNAIYKHSFAQFFPAGMVEPVQMLDGGGAEHSFEVGDIMTPMSRGDLLISEDEHFEWVEVDSSSFLDTIPSVEYMSNKKVELSMSSFKGMAQAAQCQGSQLPLMLPLQGMLLDGALFYCFEAQGDVVVLTWDLGATHGYRTTNRLATNCSRIREKRRFMLVLYGGSTLTEKFLPFQYMYTVEQATDGQWGVACTARWYQDIDPFAAINQNWDRLYILSPRVLKMLWPNISSCAEGTWGPADIVLDNGLHLAYRVEVSKGLARDDNAVLYPHFSAQSMDTLQGSFNASHMFRLASSEGSGMCVLKKVNGTPGVIGAGSFDIATQSIGSLLTLGINSGYGSQNLPLMRQQMNDMSGQFASLTIAAAVTAAMTSVVAAYSANVFTLKIKFLKATNLTRLTIRALVSVVEAAVASVAAITAMWALYTNGKASRTMQWVDSQKETPCDYEICNLYISTAATICGSADYLVGQWAVLGLGALLATVLIMYRWHFAKGGSTSDWIAIDKEPGVPKGDGPVSSDGKV